MASIQHKKNQRNSPENAYAKKALEAIEVIDREAQQKKQAQLEALQEAKAAIHERLNELNHQLEQLEHAIETISGRPAKGPRQKRRDWSEVRERVVRWMAARAGEKFAGPQLVQEFPELEGQFMSVFLKSALDAGEVKADQSEGLRKTKYFVA